MTNTSHRTYFLLLGSLFLILTFRGASAQQVTVQEADAAFTEGKTAVALGLYEELVKADASNAHALMRSAQLLSWEKRYSEAIARYDAAIKLDSRNVAAIMERAKILSWASRYDESLLGFREMLKIEPGNYEARLGVARTLSWSGRLAEARSEYQKVGVDRPDDVDVLVGVAQTYAWAGDRSNARIWYDRALRVDPTSLGANLGVAYLELNGGKRRASRARANDLARRFPADNDVRELGLAIQAASRPQAELTQERLEDSDSNELGLSRARVIFPALGRAEVSAAVARYAMDSGQRSGKIDTAHVQATLSLPASTRLTLRGGVDRSENSSGATRSTPTGTLSFAAGNASRLAFTAFADRDTFKYSVPILDSEIDLDTLGLRLDHASDRWILGAGASAARFSDDNDRLTGDAIALYRWPLRALSIATGYGYRYLDFDRSMMHGYFDPQDYNAHTAQLRISRRIGKRAEVSLGAEGGVQSFTHRGVSTDNDRFLAGNGTLTLPLGRALLLDLSAARSESAISAASGFESTQYSIRLRTQR